MHKEQHATTATRTTTHKRRDGMICEATKDGWRYRDDNCVFVLKTEALHNHETTIIAPKHIKLLKNYTGIKDKELKERIVEAWFAEQNEKTRTSNNLKRRSK